PGCRGPPVRVERPDLERLLQVDHPEPVGDAGLPREVLDEAPLPLLLRSPERGPVERGVAVVVLPVAPVHERRQRPGPRAALRAGPEEGPDGERAPLGREDAVHLEGLEERHAVLAGSPGLVSWSAVNPARRRSPNVTPTGGR